MIIDINSYKSLVSSSFQKSTRRGLIDLALSNFDVLYKLDPKYSFYRLLTVLIEDFGVSNLKLLQLVISATTSKTYLNFNSEYEFYRFIVKQMCVSPKDRSPINIAIMDYQGNDFRLLQYEQESKYIATRYLDDLNGVPQINYEQYSDFKFFSSYCLGFPQYYNEIFDYTYKVKNLFYQIYIPYIYLLINQNIEDGLKFGKYSTNTYFRTNPNNHSSNQILIDSIDSHSSYGSTIIKEWLSFSSVRYPFLCSLTPSVELRFDIFKMIHFNEIGSLVDKKLIHEFSVIYAKESNFINSKILNITPKQYEDLKSEFLTNIDSFRAFIVDSFCKVILPSV